MSSNLLDSISGVFNNELISKAASSLGESDAGISRALTAGIPSLLSGILNSAGADNGANLLKLSKQAAASGVLDNPGGLFGGSNSSSLLSAGSGLLSGLFGSKAGSLISIISSFAGVKQSTASSVLSAVAPVALGFIGKHALGNNLSGSGILSWITGQKSHITNALPAGLNLSGLLDTDKKIVYVEPEKKGNKWLVPLLLSLLGIALLWYFLKGCNNEEATPPVTDSVVVTPPVVNEPVVTAPVPESFMVKLPDGTELNAFKGGIEDKLVAFLNDPNSKVSNDTWFDFDNLNFETGSAKITAESQAQVNNIAAILKAYPKVAIKIGGYTDVTGDAAANTKLSQDRADATVAAIKTAGAEGTQLVGAEGYGSKFAKAAADASDEEKKKDRRIAVSVRKK